MALIIGFAVPMANVAAVYGLARHNGGSLLRELARNPLVVSTRAGLACNLAGLQLPGPVDTVLARLGAAAIALGILCVGA
ncbi:AEC family transporter, partial [Salmonella enterica]|nr:AEC family transporter [Salmonella enterica]